MRAIRGTLAVLVLVVSVVVLAATPSAAQSGTGTVSGVLWLDADGNGQRGSTEVLLRSVQVALYPCVTANCAVSGAPALPAATAPLYTTTTDTGAYTFSSVPVGRWRVRVTGASPTAVATSKFVGAAATDSHLNPSFESDLLTVKAGTLTYSGIDGGMWDCMSDRTTYTVRGTTATSNEVVNRYPSNYNVTYTDGLNADGWSTASSTADLRATRWNVPWAFDSSYAWWPVKFEAGEPNVCMVGGDNKVNLPATAPWAFGWPYTYNAQCGTAQCKYWKFTGGMFVRGDRFNVRGANIHDVGDGIAISGSSDPTRNPHNWSIKGTRVADAHDDCIENDGGFKGSLDDTLLDGCFVFYSDQEGAQTYPAGEGVAITNTLVRMKEMPGTFCMEPNNENRSSWYDPALPHAPGYVPLSNAACDPGTLNVVPGQPYAVPNYAPGHNEVFKFHTSDPATLTMRNSTLYAKTPSQAEDMKFPERAGAPRIDYSDPERCSNNVLYWDGPYSTLPAGWIPAANWSTDADLRNDWPKCFTVKTTDYILDASVSTTKTALTTNVWWEWSIIRQLWLNAHAQGGGFTPLAEPKRVFDSRTGPGTQIGTSPTTVTLPTNIGLPAAGDIGGLVLNVTAIQPTTETFLTAWGTGPKPSTSTVHLAAGEIRANGTTVQPGVGAANAATIQLSTATGTGTSHVVVDVIGYYRKYADPNDLVYVPATTPTRLIDTRTSGGAITAGQNRFIEVPSGGANPVPAAATAIIANVTAVEPTVSTYLKAYPANLTTAQVTAALPSTVNAAAGQNVANQTVIKLGTSDVAPGTRGFDLMNNVGSSHAVVDIVGWFMPAGTVDGLHYYPVTPTRIADTRDAILADGSVAKLTNGTPRPINLRRGPGAGARVANVNITVAGGTAAGVLQAYSAANATAPPLTQFSNLNYATGQTVGNNATIALGDNRVQADIGRAKFLSTSANVDVIVDLTGYFAPPNQITVSPYSAIP